MIRVCNLYAPSHVLFDGMPSGRALSFVGRVRSLEWDFFMPRRRRETSIVLTLALCAGLSVSPMRMAVHPTPASRPVDLVSIHMIDARVGWALSTHAVLRTIDGGARWADVTPQGVTVAGSSGTAMAFLSTRIGWVVVSHGGHMGIVIRTTDGGRTWRSTSIGFARPAIGVRQISFIDARHGWLLVTLTVTAGANSAVQIFRTSDGGTRWISVSYTAVQRSSPGSLPYGGSKEGLGFRDPTTGFAGGRVDGPAGFVYLYVSHDGGATWRHQGLTLPASYGTSYPTFAAPTFYTPVEGILPVTFAAAQLVYITHNGGRTWQATRPLHGPVTLSFGDPQHGWALGAGVLYTTRDEGRHWATMSSNIRFQQDTVLDPTGGAVAFALRRTAAGGPTTVFRTTDGGRVWEARYPQVVLLPKIRTK